MRNLFVCVCVLIISSGDEVPKPPNTKEFYSKEEDGDILLDFNFVSLQNRRFA